jgi:hypothetical protein
MVEPLLAFIIIVVVVAMIRMETDAEAGLPGFWLTSGKTFLIKHANLRVRSP